MLLLTPGIRVELIGNRYDDALAGTLTRGFSAVVLPGLGALYRITPEWSVLAGAYRGFSPVSPGQRPEVQPELSVNSVCAMGVPLAGLTPAAKLLSRTRPGLGRSTTKLA